MKKNNTRKKQKEKKIIIFGHRGAPDHEKENTILSFAYAPKGMNDKDIRKLYDSVMGTFSLRKAEGGGVGSLAMNKENVKQ